MVSAVLERLEPFHGTHRAGRVQVDARLLRAGEHGSLAGQLRHQDLAPVADDCRLDVLERTSVGAHPCDVHPALVGERVPPDPGLVGVRCEVADLVHHVRGLGERRELLVRHAFVAELELEGRQDRHEVRVPAALAQPVHRALDETGSLLDGGDRVGDAALGVVVGVDPDSLRTKTRHGVRSGAGYFGRET